MAALPPTPLEAANYFINQEFDDLLLCSDSNGAEYLVAKPPALRASAWKGLNGWQPGQSPNWIDIGYGQVMFVYLCPFFRIRITSLHGSDFFNVAVNQLWPALSPTDQGTTPQTNAIDYYATFEYIDPFYYPLDNDIESFGLPLASQFSVTQPLGQIQTLDYGAVEFQTSVAIDNFPALTNVTTFDLNRDGRKWTAFNNLRPDYSILSSIVGTHSNAMAFLCSYQMPNKFSQIPDWWPPLKAQFGL